jgi:hypothetical protein
LLSSGGQLPREHQYLQLRVDELQIDDGVGKVAGFSLHTGESG